MYNQESENVYGQEYVPYESYTSESHEPYEPMYTGPYPAYQSDAPYPPYPTDTHNATQYSEYSGYSHYPQPPRRPYGEEKAQRPLYLENRSRRVTKAEATEMVGRFKQWIVIGSLLAFAVLSGLAFSHVTGVASQAPGGFPFHDDDHGPSQQFHEPSHHGFFQQQGGSGIGNNGPAQGPVSGSNVS